MSGRVTVRPVFYDGFACKAQFCRHSCCRGWEIDVDEDTAALYETLPGPLGEELRAALGSGDGERCFRLRADGRCPFLRDNGLCRVILTYGEDALCDICALHPRFFEEFGGFTLAGLGLSCERSCELLLAGEGPLRFLVEDEARALTLPELLRRMGYAPGEITPFSGALDREGCARMLALYARTEAIDEDWPRELAALRERLSELDGRHLPERLDRYERIYHYILYRQLDRLDGYSLRALCAFAALGAHFVLLQDLLYGVDAEHLRRWSEQIEYSTENPEIILRALSGGETKKGEESL